MNNNKIKEIGIIIMNMALKELQNWVNMKDGKKLKKLKWKTPKNLQVMEEKQPLGKDHMNNIKKDNYNYNYNLYYYFHKIFFNY